MFFDELSNLLGLEGATKNTYKIFCYNGTALEIIGTIKIKLFTLEKIILQVANKTIQIEGDYLKIKDLSLNNIVVSGKIRNILTVN